MKIIFMGTPSFSVNSLEKLINENYEIVAVITQPDKVQGRRREIVFSPVKEYALSKGLHILQPNKISDITEELISLGADLIVTAAYGQILPMALLDAIKAINVHGSLLPKYRGGAPIQYALFDGLKKTGITIMDMAFKMDSGDIILQEDVEILEEDNYETLSNKLAVVGADLLVKTLKGNYPRIQQDESKVTFAYTLKREDEYLNFYDSAETVINRLRGLLPEPGGSFKINGINIKVFKMKKSDIIKDMEVGSVCLTNKNFFIKTKTAIIEIIELQVSGKNRMDVHSFLNGQKFIKNNDFIERL